jgi:hypothetical protein
MLHVFSTNLVKVVTRKPKTINNKGGGSIFMKIIRTYLLCILRVQNYTYCMYRENDCPA